MDETPNNFSSGSPLNQPSGEFLPPQPSGGQAPVYAPPVEPETAFGSPVTSGPNYVLSGWWQRVGAAVIDALILIVIAILVAIPLAVAGLEFGSFNFSSSAASFDQSASEMFASMITSLIAQLLYYPFVMVRTNGQTLGKMATNIRVVRADGSPVTHGFAIKREVLTKGLLFGVVGQVLIFIPFILNYLWPLWDKENRALHDMIVNSRVVKNQ